MAESHIIEEMLLSYRRFFDLFMSDIHAASLSEGKNNHTDHSFIQHAPHPSSAAKHAARTIHEATTATIDANIRNSLLAVSNGTTYGRVEEGPTLCLCQDDQRRASMRNIGQRWGRRGLDLCVDPHNAQRSLLHAILRGHGIVFGAVG